VKRFSQRGSELEQALSSNRPVARSELIRTIVERTCKGGRPSRSRSLRLAFALVLTAAMLLLAAGFGGGDVSQSNSATLNQHANSVIVCHIPSGNANNPRTIIIGAPAVPVHLAQGDAMGACG